MLHRQTTSVYTSRRTSRLYAVFPWYFFSLSIRYTYKPKLARLCVCTRRRLTQASAADHVMCFHCWASSRERKRSAARAASVCSTPRAFVRHFEYLSGNSKERGEYSRATMCIEGPLGTRDFARFIAVKKCLEITRCDARAPATEIERASIFNIGLHFA